MNIKKPHDHAVFLTDGAAWQNGSSTLPNNQIIRMWLNGHIFLVKFIETKCCTGCTVKL